ncbi:VOC family protein [Streptomyces sp. NPDC002845]
MAEAIRWTYAFIDRPAAEFDAACDFWTAVTGTKPSESRGERGEFVTLLPDGHDGADACLKAQAVEAAPGGAHLDLAVADVPALVASALDLGAEAVTRHDGWAVLRSPGGQLFCAVPWHGESVRPPVVDGSRLDQVCVDVRPAAYDAEIAFWAELTGWESGPTALPEFHFVRPPADLPVRILVQRLGTDTTGDTEASDLPASAHLDLACADIDAVRAGHERLGATFVAHGTSWTVMRDPAGSTYCLTGRDPETGIRPPATRP